MNGKDVIQHVGNDDRNGGSNKESLRPSCHADAKFDLWARQLIPFLDEKSVIFTCYSEGVFRKIQLVSVVKLLKELDYFEAVEAINGLPHPNFVKVTFDATSMVEIFMDTAAYLDGHPIKYVEKSMYAQLCNIVINNLPPDLIKQFIEPILCRYGEVIRVTPQLIPRLNGGAVQIGQTRLDLKLKDGISALQVPYFIKVYGFKVFINIRGRQRVCYRCSSQEHLVNLCPYRFCGLCRGLKEVEHLCVLSYAAAANNENQNAQLMKMHDSLLDNVEGKEEEANGVGAGTDNLNGMDMSSEQVEVGSVSDPPEEAGVLNVSSDVKEMKGQSHSGEMNQKRMRTRSLTRNDGKARNKELIAKQDNVRSDHSGVKESKPLKRVKVEKSGVGKALMDSEQSVLTKDSAIMEVCYEKEEPPEIGVSSFSSGLLNEHALLLEREAAIIAGAIGVPSISREEF